MSLSLNESLRLPVRLSLLALLVVIVQEAAVSQITIFGTSADITPLVVMSVGLLPARSPGRSWALGRGSCRHGPVPDPGGDLAALHRDWVLVGPAAELRDPAHGLVPMAVGAAATAFAGLGMTLIQFLLGVDSPVSWLLLQQILVAVLVNALISLPIYAFVRRVLRGALPEDPRQRRRHRAYTTGGLSPLQEPAAGRVRATTRAASR